MGQLVVQGANRLALNDISGLAKTFYDSGMFKDVRSEAQAKVKILAGQEIGIGPMQSMTQIYIVEGKVTLSAPLIGGLVKRSGRYDYRVDEHTDTACKLTFMDRGVEVGESRFTMDDAKVAGLAGKGVWKSYPRNMLFARAVTNGARWYCADVFGGAIYTPEELGAVVSITADGGEAIDATFTQAVAASAPTSAELQALFDEACSRGVAEGGFGPWCVANVAADLASRTPRTLSEAESIDARDLLTALIASAQEPAQGALQPAFEEMPPAARAKAAAAVDAQIADANGEQKPADNERDPRAAQKAMFALCNERGITEAKRKAMLIQRYAVVSSNDLTPAQLSDFLDFVKEHPVKGTA